MSTPVIAFFNNKGGVGKTSLVYHLTWMYATLGYKIVAADLDPQANLTAAFISEENLEKIWPADGLRPTVYGAISPLVKGVGDISKPSLMEIEGNIHLIPGDLALSGFEDELSSQWPDCLDGKERAFRVISAFWRLLMLSADEKNADLVLVDVGPNLGAINRSALVSADYVVLPLAPDLFSVQGLRNLGPQLRRWRDQWRERIQKNPDPDLELPSGSIAALGYVLLQHGVRLGQPVGAYRRFMHRIPSVYRQAVLAENGSAPPIDEDPHCLAQIKHYRSLVPMALEARKPVFDLKPADGAFGGHQRAVADSRKDFIGLAEKVLEAIGNPVPMPGFGVSPEVE